MRRRASVEVSEGTRNREIHTRPRTHCYLCGAAGNVLHEGLVDSLADTIGVWSFRRCTSASCGLIWLDPVPFDEDLPLAYETYPTHRSLPSAGRTAPPWSGPVSGIGRLLGHLPGYAGVREEHSRRAREYLGDLPPGHLIEVGCGNGSRLRKMQGLGWGVVGQDVDPQATAIAEETGARVHLGPLEEAQFPSGSFDAVLMVHVIEHLFDPIGILRECRRILRGGGRLVVITPNADSYGHERFGRSWSGIDPPRHIYLFTRSTLGRVAAQAGFLSPQTWTTEANAFSSLSGSLYRRREGHHPAAEPGGVLDRSIVRAFQYWAALELLADPDSGEECALVATTKE